MASLLELRRKISGIKSTRRVTNAMKIVAATKVRRAQDSLFRLRPYAWRMRDVLRSLASRTDAGRHPLLKVPEKERRVELVIVTSDKGLCGAFNQNIIREATRFLHSHEAEEFRLRIIGRKGYEYFKKRPWPIIEKYIDVFRMIRYEDVIDVADTLIHEFTSGHVDAIYVVYNEFKSAIVQKVLVERLLPLERETFSPKEPPIGYIYEPSPEKIFADLLPRHVHVQLYRIFLESQAAEHSARMVAMDSATRNADKEIRKYTLILNKTRQAHITKEILEVVNAAEALRRT